MLVSTFTLKFFTSVNSRQVKKSFLRINEFFDRFLPCLKLFQAKVIQIKTQFYSGIITRKFENE